MINDAMTDDHAATQRIRSMNSNTEIGDDDVTNFLNAEVAEQSRRSAPVPRAQQRTTFEWSATNLTASPVWILLRPRTGALRRGAGPLLCHGTWVIRAGATLLGGHSDEWPDYLGANMQPFLAELVGTMILVILGDGVVANVLLSKTKGQNSGWIVVTTGWGLGVALAIYTVRAFSGAHLNPAVTLGMAAIGKFPWGSVAGYVLAQIIGAVIGGILVWLAYLPHWQETTDPGTKLAVFCTGPAIPKPTMNLLTEMIGTFVLVLGVLAILSPNNLVPNSDLDKGFGPLLVGVLVWSIGLSLGGPTGYAINPARDFGPRLAHALLPIPGKGDSQWSYAWVPVVGPILGGILGAWFYKLLWHPA